VFTAPLHAGHAIGVVVAETEAAAQAAARAVEVTYRDIVPVLSIEQAIETGSYFEVQTFTIYRMSSKCAKSVPIVTMAHQSRASHMPILL